MIAIGINVVFVGLLIAVFFIVPKFLAPTKTLAGDKGMPYETGMPPLDSNAKRLWISYYRYAILFVIFDVDIALLIPWVLLRDQLTLEAMAAMSIFLCWLGITLAYLWRKGALEC